MCSEILKNIFFIMKLRLYSRKWFGTKPKAVVNRAVSRKFHTILEARIEQLKKKNIKKRKLNKMMWGVREYNA